MVRRTSPIGWLTSAGECKRFMTDYLGCLKTSRGDNKPCRIHSKRYLACRMDRCVDGDDVRLADSGSGLMEKDDWANLGYADVTDAENPDTDRNRGVPYVSKAAEPVAAPSPQREV